VGPQSKVRGGKRKTCISKVFYARPLPGGERHVVAESLPGNPPTETPRKLTLVTEGGRTSTHAAISGGKVGEEGKKGEKRVRQKNPKGRDQMMRSLPKWG